MGAAATTADGAQAAGGGKAGGRRKLVILAVPVLLAAIGAGLWFGGILPPLLSMGGKPHSAAAHGAKAGEAAANGAASGADGQAAAKVPAPVYLEMPEIIANLNAGPRRASYVKLHTRLELARPEDVEAVKAAMPRLLDLFQTYLREMRPEELRGSAGTYRLREELIGRANVAVAPARVVDVLFTEMLIQ